METVYPLIDGVGYEIANFDTEPFDTVDEFLLYKKTAQDCAKTGCLRTIRDWDKFFVMLENKSLRADGKISTAPRIADMEWSRIMTLVMGYRLGYWDIPYLSDNHKLDDKISYINGLSNSKKRFTKSNWKDCRKENRAGQMLDKKYIKDLLLACGAIIGGKVS